MLTLPSAVGALLAVGTGSASAASSTVALWHMNETSGTQMIDSSGRHNNGTITSGVAINQPGASGKAYRFTTGHVTVPNNASLNPGKAPIVISAEIKLLSSVPAPTEAKDFDVIRKGLSSTSGGDWKMEVTNKASCEFHFNGAEHVVQSAATVKRDNAFHAYVCRKTSTSISVTLDGKTTTRAVSGGAITNTAPVVVGAKSTSGGDQTNAVVDEVSVVIG
jgi:Concanavalin A-like lectin/glucanases superfamily